MTVASSALPKVTADRISPTIARLVLSCFIGTTAEAFDFFIYAFLTPLAFNRLFFPSLDPTVGTIAALGVFAVGIVARPLGGIVFGHFGDRVGRRPIMVLTLAGMGVSTAFIGLIPTYAGIGLAAPVLLTVLRLLQGFFYGGEHSVAPVLVAESTPAERRGFLSSPTTAGILAGTVLAALAADAISRLPEDALLQWGWRAPFILSIFVVLVGLYIRLKIEESPSFLASIAVTPPHRVPFIEVIRVAKRSTVIAILVSMAESSIFYFTSVFGLSYGLGVLHLPKAALFDGILIGNAIGVFVAPLFGLLSDVVGRRTVMASSLALAALYVWLAFFQLLGSGNPSLITLAMAIAGAILQPMSLGVHPSFYPELFPDVRIRFTGVALGLQFGTILGGGLMPVISASLLAASGGGLTYVVPYFVASCAIGVVATFFAKDRRFLQL